MGLGRNVGEEKIDNALVKQTHSFFTLQHRH